MQLPTVTIEQKPAFCDFDPMGVVWHGSYFRFFEIAREALLDSIDYGYIRMTESNYVWPIVDTRVKYIAPITCGASIRVTATIAEYENRLRINYEIRDAATNKLTTRAHTLQIAVNKTTREMCFVSPPALLEKLNLPRA